VPKTIAAATTAVLVAPGGGIPSFDHVVRFDRSFFYAIVDRPTRQILFLGRVLDPSAG
jgi:serine protease inhibitor